MPKRSRWYYEVRWLVRVLFWGTAAVVFITAIVSLAVFITSFINYIWYGN